jgi:alkyl sulfatase BDS1-like metallo-beta-lactamase superfamily hydrolase
MGRLTDITEQLWTGALSTADRHPLVAALQEMEELAPGVAFVSSFANVTAFATDAGLVLVDVGSQLFAAQVHEIVRGWSDRPLHTAIYTHGHVDHVFGVERYEAEARAGGAPPPRVVAHEAVADRFDRYRMTAGYNAIINRRQFRVPNLVWPVDYRYPDVTYRKTLALDVGGTRFVLTHDRGETDDHTWVWIPERKILCTGDLFIWAAPNCGNPQKVQRYPLDWARALRAMDALAPELLCPGHGYPIRGRARVHQALVETAELLESLHEQTLRLMNEGARLDEVLHAVRPPAHLLERPYLRPVYDDPEFIVRNIWRLYGGWYDGNPAHLKPAPDAAVARELAALAGGAGRLAERAQAVAAAGDLALACHLIELATQAAPADDAIRAARAAVYAARAEREPSTMAKGIYGWAAAESGATPGPKARSGSGRRSTSS